MAIAGLLSNRMIRQIQYRMGDVFMRQCERGHFYDDTRFASCNYCKDGTGLGYQAVAAFQNNPRNKGGCFLQILHRMRQTVPADDAATCI